MPHLILAFFLALVISLLAYRVKTLNRGGLAAATLLGGVVFGLGGLEWAILLLTFFLSSSGLSRLAGKRKTGLLTHFSKGGRRDAGQVLANGAVAGACVLLHAIFPQAAWTWVAFAGSLAAVNADTWATELGVLSSARPRMVTTGQQVERGTSGGISLFGSLSAVSAAMLIGIVAVVLRLSEGFALSAVWLVVIYTTSGSLGSLVDSVLGATLQANFHCPACHKETERHPFHTCGATTIRVRGFSWMNNDVVNLLCALSGAFSAVGFFYLLTLGI